MRAMGDTLNMMALAMANSCASRKMQISPGERANGRTDSRLYHFNAFHSDLEPARLGSTHGKCNTCAINHLERRPTVNGSGRGGVGADVQRGGVRANTQTCLKRCEAARSTLPFQKSNQK